MQLPNYPITQLPNYPITNTQYPISNPQFPNLLALLAALLALIRAWGFALTQNSLMDEGEYLLKGWLFVSGQYRPFQDYGLWTNHMPLSFLIPGWVQALFGVGLRTGRLYALGLNALILLGLWIVARRLSNRWLAAGVLWVYALNTATLKMYSTATSQVLIAAMLVWVLVLIVGENRPRWQLVLGSALAGVMLLTRLNLAPALPLVLAYIFWQHGRREGLWAAAAMLLTLLIGHALFWPGILRMWAAWAPPALTPFLAAYRPPAGLPAWNPDLDLNSRVLSFFFSVRYHFVAVLGLLAAALLWPREWPRPAQRRAALFLAALFGVLLLAHGWASLGVHDQTDAALGNDYCVYCFPVYTSFFSFTGLLLIAALLPVWPHTTGRARTALTALTVLLLSTGVGYAAYKQIGEPLARLRIPRLKTLLAEGRWAEAIPLWDVLQTRFHLGFETTKRLLPALAGLLAGLLILLLALWLQKRLARGRGLAPLALLLVLIAGTALTPTALLSAGYNNYDCTGNVIAAYETAGAHLAANIPPASRLYWQGSLSSAPLLYLDSPQLLPGQINLTYTLRLSGDDDEHRRFGFWSEPLARDWLAQADYAIVSERYFTGWLRDALQDPTQFTELPPTPPLAPCDPGSYLRIFRRTGGLTAELTTLPDL